jgi:hypothetical protein
VGLLTAATLSFALVASELPRRLLPNNLADKEQGVSKTRQPVEKVLVGPVIVSKQEQNTPKHPKTGVLRS